MKGLVEIWHLGLSTQQWKKNVNKENFSFLFILLQFANGKQIKITLMWKLREEKVIVFPSFIYKSDYFEINFTNESHLCGSVQTKLHLNWQINQNYLISLFSLLFSANFTSTNRDIKMSESLNKQETDFFANKFRWNACLCAFWANIVILRHYI